MNNSDILFVGWGGPEGVSHYRTILPATAIGAEWVIFGMDGKPMMGEGVNKTHRVIIVQNCWYDWQLRIINRMKLTGAKVIFNVDDWIKGIGRREKSHGHAALFGSKEVNRVHDLIWSLCDGAIVSTPWLAEKVRSKTPQVEVARNGIDPGRYQAWADPIRDHGTIIGWAGGTGHREALAGIADAVSRVVSENEGTSLWIVGQDESDLFECSVHHVGWSDMYQYPRHLACFDISLAPSEENDFYRAKSQLRLYEAFTLGTPSLVGPLYDEIGMAGLSAVTPEQWHEMLTVMVQDPKLRDTYRHYALKQAKEVTIDARKTEWISAIAALCPTEAAGVHRLPSSEGDSGDVAEVAGAVEG